jgi:hypothetical protein
MTATEILKITRPEWLFTGNPDENKQKHRDLAKEWHPDVNKDKDAEHVFQHISHLWEQAEKKLADGCWGFAGVLMLTAADKGRGIHMKYHAHRPFELGEFYIGDNAVLYVLDKEHENLFYNGKVAMETFKYPSKKVEEECSRYLPKSVHSFKTVDGKFAIAIAKTPDMFLLKDVLKHFGTLHPTQAAWIMSTLFNLGCYLWVSEITHNDISLDTYFISPEKHSGALLGGWWYASPRGHTLSQIPRRTFDYLPWKVKSTKKASRLTDQELIRLVGRELLVGSSGVPEPMKEWLDAIASEDAVTAYSHWSKEVLIKSFGKRRFVKMDLTANELYK